jgi:hypothetical protein
MSSFNNLLKRIEVIGEGKVSPYSKYHPAFNVTGKMRSGGLSSAPLDTIKFIRETLYNLDIIDEAELNLIKKSPGFTGKKTALLKVLQSKQSEINANSKEIADRIEDTLDDFISGVTIDRGRDEKYAAQAAAQQIAREVRKTRSGKEMDDALADTVSDEKLLIVASIAKVIGEVEGNLGEEGFDISPDALDEVKGQVHRIDTLEKLKSFIKQISGLEGYEKLAAYLSVIVRPVEAGLEDEEMIDNEEAEEGSYGYEDVEGMESLEEYDVNEDEYDEAMSDGEGDLSKIDHPVPPEAEDAYINSIKAALKASPSRISEKYTATYLTEQVHKDRLKIPAKDKAISFRERYKPKTSYQLEELRRYGL